MDQLSSFSIPLFIVNKPKSLCQCPKTQSKTQSKISFPFSHVTNAKQQSIPHHDGMLETRYEIKHGLQVSSLGSGYCFALIGAGKCICIGMECLQYLSPDRLNAESFLSQPFLVLVAELIYNTTDSTH